MATDCLRMSDFEWASATRYCTWLSGYLSLKDVKGTDITSFGYQRWGYKGLVRRKSEVRSAAKYNVETLEFFLEKYELTSEEVAVVDSLISQWRAVMEICDSHIMAAEVYNNVSTVLFDEPELVDSGEGDSELLF